jgi:flagellar protein FlbD
MIRLTRLNKTEFCLNAELIKFVEATPDTIITLVNDQKVLVQETVDEVLRKVIEYKRSVNTWNTIAGIFGTDDSE